MPTRCDTSSTLTSDAGPTDAAFYVVFGIFVVAMVVLAVIIVVWAVRHDMTGWKAWRKDRRPRPALPHPAARRSAGPAPVGRPRT